jgi:multidrug efflux system membrane fusion protein
MRRVRLGVTENDWVAVQGELAAGEKVVTDGADRLREGAKVEVIAPQRGPGGFGPGGGFSPGGGGRRDGGGGGGAPAGTGARPPAGGASGASGAAGEARAEPGAPPRPRQPPAADGAEPRKPPAASAAGPAGPAPSPAAGGARPDAWIDNLPPQAQDRIRAALERMGPEMAAKVHKMSPEERREFFQKMRAQREQQGQ